MNNLEKIKFQLDESARIKHLIRDQFSETILKTAEIMIKTLSDGGKLLICGNGGSAADSQHFAAEFIGRFLIERKPLPAIALTTDTSILTAIGNDYSYDDVFKKQVQALGSSKDVLIGLSTSGNSQNVLNAIAVAKEKGMTTIGLTGKDGGQIAAQTDWSMVVPSNLSGRIQEGHITIIHIWCDLVESTLFPNA
jgi:D-sedoheptulose 7-phosphate isomerase